MQFVHRQPRADRAREFCISSRARGTLAAILLIVPALAFAHPHMFLTSKAEFVWDGARLSGCYLEWTFDQFFSADLMNFDANGDGVFNAAETKAVHEGAFSYLKNYYYFTFIRQGTKRTNPSGVSRFTVLKRKDRVAYRFFIDLSHTDPGELALAVYDYTFFCDIRNVEPEPVKLTYDSALVKPSFVIAENRDYPVYYNPLGAVDDPTVYYAWKKGLQTYYPREIRITYEK